MPPQTQSKPLARQVQSFLTRLRAKLRDRDLLDILDSLPPATSFSFFDTRIFDKAAIRFRIGLRRQSIGVQAASWAYVLPELDDMIPPVVFRDEITTASGSDDQPQHFPRAAASLLRNAEEFEPPFCFLQFDPHDNAKNVRGMVCAVVLYYTLTKGLSEHALNWSSFDDRLIQALMYISSRVHYQHWRKGQLGRSYDMMDIDRFKAVASSSRSRAATGADQISDIRANEGTIRSFGSSIEVKPGTLLAKLQTGMGDKFQMLDVIPSTPVTIEHQHVFPNYFPFRLYIGTYRAAYAYVYLTMDRKNTVKIMAHESNGGHRSWTFFDLDDLELFEPFAFFMRVSNRDYRTQGNKVRYMVYYYFMLAENLGLTGSPKLHITVESTVPGFLSACSSLEKAGFRADNIRDESSSEALSAPNESLVVTLTLRSEILSVITGVPLLGQRNEVPDSEDDECNQNNRDARATKGNAPSKPIFSHDHETVLENASSLQSIQQAGALDPNRSRVRSHDSGFASTRDSPTTNEIMASREVPSGLVIPANDSDSRTIDHGIPQQRAASVLSISSGVDEMDVVPTIPLPPSPKPPNRAIDPQGPAHEPQDSSHIIDLCSDEDGNLLLASAKSEIEETPEVEELLRTHRQDFWIVDDDELRVPDTMRKKRISNQTMSDGDDIMQVDGDAWKKASRGRSQGTQLMPPD